MSKEKKVKTLNFSEKVKRQGGINIVLDLKGALAILKSRSP